MADRNSLTAMRPRLSLILLQLFLFLTPLLATRKALVMAPALGLIALTLLIHQARPPQWQRHKPVLAAMGLLLAWGGCTALWSWDASASLSTLAMIIMTMISGMITTDAMISLPTPARSRALTALTIGVALAAALILSSGIAERFGLSSLYSVLHAVIRDGVRGAVVVSMLLPPLTVWLWRQNRPAAIALALLGAMGVLWQFDLTAKLALLAAVCGLCLTRLSGRLFVRLAATILLALALLLPLAITQLPPPQQSANWTWLPSSGHHRLTIWQFADSKIKQKPLFGWGFDSSRAQEGGNDNIYVVRGAPGGCRGINGQVIPLTADQPVPADCIAREQQLPLHPHNNLMQVWLELGLVGAILGAALLAMIARLLLLQINRSPRQCLGTAVLCGGTVIGLFGFGLWQAWWLSTALLAAALVFPATADN